MPSGTCDGRLIDRELQDQETDCAAYQGISRLQELAAWVLSVQGLYPTVVVIAQLMPPLRFTGGLLNHLMNDAM